MSLLSSSGENSRTRCQSLTSSENVSFFFAPSLVATSCAKSTPIAGADVKPGDSTPNALKKPCASGASPRTKSCLVVSCARMPLNVVIALRNGIYVQMRVERRRILSKPNAVVSVASGESMSSLVGPTIIVPSTVGETRTPFPIGPGH